MVEAARSLYQDCEGPFETVAIYYCGTLLTLSKSEQPSDERRKYLHTLGCMLFINLQDFVTLLSLGTGNFPKGIQF